MNVIKAIGWRKLRFRFDWTLTLSALTVAGARAWSTCGAPSTTGRRNLFTQQISWLGLGAAVFLGVAAFDYRNIARLGYVLHGVGVALLLGVLAVRQDGGRRAALVRPGPVPPAAVRADAAPDHRRAGQVPERLAGAGGALVAAPCDPGRSSSALPALLIAKQPDFGTAFLLLLIFFSIMMTARLKLKTLAAILGLATIAAFPIYQHLLHEYQRKRVEAFFNPNSEGAYQTRQALNAIGSGRFLGKGFLHGTQIRLRHFPALWTDFPFAVWAEEWGFVGCFVLLLAYLVVILWILKIAGEARDRFGATVCVGVAAMIFWHVIINVGMVSGTLPVVGVTLPLISYGGSSILTTAAALGLVMNVSVRRFSY